MCTGEVPEYKNTRNLLDYLKELLIDRMTISASPGLYIHVENILEEEILRTRRELFSTFGICSITEKDLPNPDGPKVNLQAKIYMPTDCTNNYNFVGRILGPNGSTAQCLQQFLGVKIMIRGRGSMRDRTKEEENIGRPNWEHLSDNLHVLITIEDYENRAKARLEKASEYISLFLQESVKVGRQHFLPLTHPYSHGQLQQHLIDVPTSQSHDKISELSRYRHQPHSQHTEVFPSSGASDLNNATMFLHNDTITLRDFPGYFGSNGQQSPTTTPNLPFGPLAINYWSCTYSGLSSPNYPIHQSQVNHVDTATNMNYNNGSPYRIHEQCSPDNVVSHNFINSLPQSNYSTPLVINLQQEQYSQHNRSLQLHGKQLLFNDTTAYSKERQFLTSKTYVNNRYSHRYHNKASSGSVDNSYKRPQKYSSVDEGNVNSNNNHSNSVGASKQNNINVVKNRLPKRSSSTATIHYQPNTNKSIVIGTRNNHCPVLSHHADAVRVNNRIGSTIDYCSNKQKYDEDDEINPMRHDEYKRNDFKPKTNHFVGSLPPPPPANTSATFNNNSSSIQRSVIVTTTTTSTCMSGMKISSQNKKGFSKKFKVIATTSITPTTSATNRSPSGLVIDEVEWPKLGAVVKSECIREAAHQVSCAKNS
ncbi:held out wings Protein [Schistosoma japonicum]|nr:held out wings Protein [Schistosoma japonicum]KAH8873189.1 held out wings Protein [Schistosoma japonicum]